LAGGELYGGSMFARSAASDTLQGRAIQSVNEKWGEDALKRSGRESLGLPVCKKKYKPFNFPVVMRKDGRLEVKVVRMFGCKCHHGPRKAVIERYGQRNGWEPFGQWSLRKAEEMARSETIRLNQAVEDSVTTVSVDLVDEGEDSVTSESSEDASSSHVRVAQNMCLNGACAWKIKSAYDDIYKEIHGHTESEAEDNQDC
jgi:hypothetical protein